LAVLTVVWNKVVHLTQLLVDNDYVIILALDFSKAFDTVRHHTLFEKFANLQSQITPTTGLCNSPKDILTVQSSETKL